MPVLKQHSSLTLTKAALLVVPPFLLAVGVAVGGVLAPSSRVVTAQVYPDPLVASACESDACVKIERRFWPDFHGCADAAGANIGCNMLTGKDAQDAGAPCENYDCDEG